MEQIIVLPPSRSPEWRLSLLLLTSMAGRLVVLNSQKLLKTAPFFIKNHSCHCPLPNFPYICSESIIDHRAASAFGTAVYYNLIV